MNNKIFYLLTFLTTTLTSVVSYSETININSNELLINRDEGKSVFKGDVYAESKNFKVWSEKLIVFFDNNNEEIKIIEAYDNVRLNRYELEAFGDKTVYIPSDNMLSIIGNVTVIENENKIQCDELIVDLENSSSIMKSNSEKRVQAIIVSKNDK